MPFSSGSGFQSDCTQVRFTVFAMTFHEFTALASVLVWPLTFLILGGVLVGSVRNLLNRLAVGVTLRRIKIKAHGVELELTREQACDVLEEELRGLLVALDQLPAEEKQLFESIRTTRGFATVKQLLPEFHQDNECHQLLLNLSAKNLIKPVEGGSWHSEKHPEVSKLGELSSELRRDSLS